MKTPTYKHLVLERHPEAFCQSYWGEGYVVFSRPTLTGPFVPPIGQGVNPQRAWRDAFFNLKEDQNK